MELSDDPTPLFNQSAIRTPQSEISLPVMPLGQEVMTDYSTTHLSLKKHPLALVRETLAGQRIITAQEVNALPHGRWVKVAGQALNRQRAAAGGGDVHV